MSPCCCFTPFHTSEWISIAISKLSVELLRNLSHGHKKSCWDIWPLAAKTCPHIQVMLGEKFKAVPKRGCRPVTPAGWQRWCQREVAALKLWRLHPLAFHPSPSSECAGGDRRLSRRLTEFVSVCYDGRWPEKVTILEHWHILETCRSDWAHKRQMQQWSPSLTVS